MIRLHHLNNSRSQRVLWLLEELDLPYEIVFYERHPRTMLAPAELKRIHPLGKSPVLEDEGVIVAESGAILEYLLETYGQGRFRPAVGSADRRRFTYFMHYAEGSLMSPLLLALIFGKMPKEPMPFFVRPIVRQLSQKVFSFLITPQIKAHAEYLESELEGRDWFAGEFSAADIQMSFPVQALLARGNIKSVCPRLVDFVRRFEARPAYQRALAKGGTFEIPGDER
ncbi:MAG: glutathione S-transferase [Bdellovibrionaceae bacterium]|nr:glutathione S-transferase [Pseudobdellovibrionaceae bacterium]